MGRFRARIRIRGTAFAVGIIVGVALSSAILVWSFPGFRNPTYQGERYSHATDADTNKPNPVVRPSFWETYTIPSDTYAQWLMAGLSLVAAATSIWAVFLVRNSLVLTRRATEAAVSANDIARKSSEAQLRAYVFPIAAKLVGTDKATPNVNIQFKNTGATPAYGVILTWHVAATHASEGFEIPKTKLPRIQPNIGPAQPITVSSYIQPFKWASILLELQSGVKALHAFGTLRYTDVFDNRHFTNFRMKVLVSAGKTIADDDFVFCDDGNDSD